MKKHLRAIDWVLLALLVVVANQAILWLKFLALGALLLARPNLRGLFRKGRLSLFIPLLLLSGSLNFLLLVRDYSGPSLMAFAVNLAFWVAAYLGAHLVKTSVERFPQKTEPTLRLFVLLNLAASVLQVARIAWQQGVWNPYNDLPFPYGMSTGDLVFGILGEASYNNAFVTALLAVYFLFKKRWLFLALCLFTELLVFGNILLLSLSFVFLLIAFAGLWKRRFPGFAPLPGRAVSVAALLSAAALLGMVLAVSPDNTRYILENTVTEKAPEETETAVARAPGSLRSQVARLDFQKYHRPARPADAQDLAHRQALTTQAVQALKGKKLSFLETAAYLRSNALSLLFGSGPGRFSSLTAARFSGLDSSRLFRKVLPSFATRAYTENHRLIHVLRVSGDPAWLSNANWPDSFFNLLPGEYGLLGVVLFLAFYVLRCLRRFPRQQYSLWLSALMVPIAALTYLVEPLCVLFFYELLTESDPSDKPVS